MATKQSLSAKSSKASAPKGATHYSDDEIKHMIAEAAYYIAEHRHFQGGNPEEDWFQAELEVTQHLKPLH